MIKVMIVDDELPALKMAKSVILTFEKEEVGVGLQIDMENLVINPATAFCKKKLA